MTDPGTSVNARPLPTGRKRSMWNDFLQNSSDAIRWHG